MGQQPNIELRIEDLPRPTAHPAAARRWSPHRPGELVSPSEIPWGGGFGTPGPDAGYALRLARARDLELADGERRADADAALAALMSVRASHYGRAPTVEDAEVAELLLGYRSEGMSPEAVADAGAARSRLVAGWSASAADRLVAAVGDRLFSDPDAIRDRLVSGELLR